MKYAHEDRRSPWPRVVLLYLCGLLAAAQLGKMSALAPLVGASLGLSLPVMAVAISLIELGGATLGASAGWLAHRVGLRRTLVGGVACLAAASLGGASAAGVTSLYGWRLVEAAGYLGVIVSAPVLIAQGTAMAGRVQGLALTLWSTFVPLGLALGAAASAAAASAFGWRAASAADGLLGVALCLLLWRVLGARPDEPSGPAPGDAGGSARPSRAAWCLALAFGGFALFQVGTLGLLPTLLVNEAGMDARDAGQWTAVASASAIAGSLLAAWLLRQGIPTRWPVLASLGAPPWLLFQVFTPGPAASVAITLAVLVNMLGGVYASLAFALLPRLARGHARMARANGLLAQCGASGSLLGPPAMAACVQAGGWHAAAGLGLVVSLAALPLAWRAATAAHLSPACAS